MKHSGLRQFLKASAEAINFWIHFSQIYYDICRKIALQGSISPLKYEAANLTSLIYDWYTDISDDLVVNILSLESARRVIVFENVLYMSWSNHFLEDVKEAIVIFYKSENISIKCPHRSTGLQLLSAMKATARTFKTGDTGTVGPKTGSV